MDARPTIDETDEDLIRQNQEFLQKIKRKTEGNADDTQDKKQKTVEQIEDFMHNEPSNILKKAMTPELLLIDVIERPVNERKPAEKVLRKKGGFPETFKRDKSLKSGSQSIFAQMQSKILKKNMPVSKVSEAGSSMECNVPEDQGIDEENKAKIESMTQEDILAAQKELLKKLDPNTIAMLKARGASKFKPKTETIKMETESNIKIPATIPESDLSNLEGLPIEPDEAKKWLHMEVVETEKLKWMTKLPTPKPIAPGQAYTARFGFDGSLMDPSLDVSVTSGLHHHGEEQERPGYTLEELLLFSRSAMPQQRVVGLSTIANILLLAKQGRLDECLDEPVIPQLVSAGLFAALRFSLDEGVAMVMEAAAHALTALLCSEPDEVCLRQLRGTSYGTLMADLRCPLEDQEEKEKGAQGPEERELKDHELLQLDVVRGALRTSLLTRIRYVLYVQHTGPSTVQCLLRILTRLAAHSREVTFEIMSCPDLIKTIVTNFVPATWESSSLLPSEVVNVYGVPQARALTLLRTVACHSRAAASDLVVKYDIATPLKAILAAEPCETGIPDGGPVVLETIYLWQALIAQGLMLSEFHQVSDIIARLLSHHCSNTGLTTAIFLQEHFIALMALIQTAVSLNNQMSSKLPREMLIAVAPALMRNTAGWLREASQSSLVLSFSSLKMIGAGLNLTAAGYTHLLHWSEVDAVSWLDQLESVIKSAVVPFLRSNTLTQLTGVLPSHSSLLSDVVNSGKKRDPRGLPSLGAVTWGQIVTPTMQADSPMPLLEPLCSFLACCCEVLPSHALSLSIILEHGGVELYLKSLSRDGCPGIGHYFSHWEQRLACCLLTVASQKWPDSTSMHCAALNLVPAVSSLKLRTKVMISWVFTQKPFQADMTAGMVDTLELKENSPAPQRSLLQQAYESIPSLYSCYENYAELPKDWPYLPLVAAAGKKEGLEKLDISLEQLEKCLQWILILEVHRPEIVKKMLSPTARFCRLCCVFLCGIDTWQHPPIHALTEAILRQILKSGDLNFSENIPGLKSFWELYVALVGEFVAESYCDPLFTNFVILPLQQKYEPVYRKYIWGEQAAAVRFIRLQPEQLMVDMKNFLNPPETEETLLHCYINMLRSNCVQGVLATITAHHLSTFINIKGNESMKTKFEKMLETAPPQIKQLFSNTR